MTDQSRICPDCSSRLAFSGDGRSMICERCGYTQSLNQETEKRTLAQFKRLRFFQGGAPNASNAATRVLIQQGKAAAQEGRHNEACEYFEKVIITNPSSDDEMEAWYWLSTLYEDPAEKRECLGETLALNPAHGLARRDLAILDGRIAQDELIDPNRPQTRPRQKQKQAAQAAKMECPQCASPMRFNAEQTVLICDHCHYEELLPDAYDDLNRDEQFGRGAFEQDFTAALHTAKGHLKPQAMRILQCQSCGVQFVLSPATMSVTCPYCTAQYVTESAETRQLLPPQALVPFGVTNNQVKQILHQWFQKHKLIKSEGFRVSKLLGVYLPVWTFDISGDIKWSGMVQQTNPLNGQQEWEKVTGSKYLFFDDYLIPATARRSKMLRQTVDEFDLQKLVEYDPRYLADWPAERYKVKLSDAGMMARNEVAKGVRARPHQLTSYDVRNLTIGTSALIIESYKLIFLPVWTAHYRSEGKTYDVYVNGQNGRVHGERNQNPVQKLLSWLTGG
ncbi:MAG: hypothetical protein KDE51_05750 [Anaerolineales bacterium]|nr:hypothetical protein [Anaerolineales bacterium]